MKYKTELIGKREIAEGTTEFSFSRPNGFEWRAGQSIDLSLINPPETDTEGNIRSFSIASAPYERDIVIATRMRDTAFKRVLGAGEPGLSADIEGPFGSMTLHEKSERPAIILAGGIGVTPFHSIVSDAAERGLPHVIYMFYSNRRPVDAVYLSQLHELEGKNRNFKLIPTMTGEASDWSGERGRIDMDMVARHAPDISNAVFYSAGPLGFVAAIIKMLRAAGVSDDDMRTEEFTGY